MRWIGSVVASRAILLALLAILPSNGMAQENQPDTTSSVLAGALFWPSAAIKTALSYIRLTPADLALRTDYVPRDSSRLPCVDRIMQNPQAAPAVLLSSASAFFAGAHQRPSSVAAHPIGIDWASLEQMATGTQESIHDGLLPDSIPVGAFLRWHIPLHTTRAVLRRGQQHELKLPTGDWTRFLNLALAALTDTGWVDTVLGSLSVDDRQFVLARAPGFLEEDEADRDKPEETLDSLQKIEDLDAERFAALSGPIRWTWVHEHGVSVVAKIAESLPLRAPQWDNKSGMGGEVMTFDTPAGPLVFGTTGSDHFTGNPAMIVDPGGDDLYELEPLAIDRHRLILDYAGNDQYLAPAGNDLGAARFGWSILADFAGNDSYTAGSFSLGSGWFGVGLLCDMGGRDRYSGDTHTQGAGSFGVGVLFDADVASADEYSARLYGQGFGSSAGLGILADAGGNDIYTAGGKYEDVLRYRDHYLSLSQGFAYGIRPHISGGIGLLLDQSGNDVYIADIFGQGCSYWWSFGGLYDGGGNDQYIAYQYAQGSATHMTAGCLYDVAGDDRYESKGVSQGCGHDWSVALLIDSAGNDRYIATDLSQAAGSANGVGILIDGSGDDGYYTTSMVNTQGYGNPRREYGSVGLFLDLAGVDHYDGPGHDRIVWLSQSRWGVGVDADSVWLSKNRNDSVYAR